MTVIGTPFATTIIRPTPQFVPSDLADLYAWWDATDSSTLTIATGVSEWADKSGNGFDLTQTTGARQPVTGTRTIGGLNALEFHANRFILVEPFTMPNDCTIYLVSRAESVNTNTFDAVFSFNANANDFQIDAGSGTGDRFRFRLNPAGLGAQLRQVTPNYVNMDTYARWRFDLGNEIACTINNGVSAYTSPYSTGFGVSGTSFRLAVNRNLNEFLRCVIGEVIIYESALSNDDDALVQDYLARKWNFN